MNLPAKAADTGGRLSGDDMSTYFESFAETLLPGKIKFGTEVINISRVGAKSWAVKTSDGQEFKYSRIVLCTGVSYLVLRWFYIHMVL
jgi:dimethylaniline monooxygenase (N-oxide forming)